MSMMRQIVAATRINILSIPQRVWMSMATVTAVAFVVAVLLGFLAMANGFTKTMSGTGSRDVALVLRQGSEAELNSVLSREQQQILTSLPGIAQKKGIPLVSGEVFVIVDAKKKSTGAASNLPLRGIGELGLDVRDGVKLTAGRMFSPGSNEIVVGSGVLREFVGFELGTNLRLGNSSWKVVGVFDASGSVFESELWADAKVVQSLFNRGNSIQSMRVRLTDPKNLSAFQKELDKDPRLKLAAKSERDFFASQSKQLSGLITVIGWPLSIAMALGALAGALNTMYSSVAERTREIATLRTIGFGGLPTFIATFMEALVLALIGALIGVLLAWLFFDGLSASTLGNGFTQVVFKFDLTPKLILQAIVLALSVGIIGGILPAIRAARIPLTQAMQE
jgi:putative ABC transport system permease protein